jgi:nitrogen fixation NifU-like protein
MSVAASEFRVAVQKDNPLCGDAIDMTIDLADGRIAAASHRARACSLVKASAALLATSARGRTPDEARALAARVDGALHGNGRLPDGFEDLAPVLLMPSRRGCVLLPWLALLDALEVDR